MEDSLPGVLLELNGVVGHESTVFWRVRVIGAVLLDHNYENRIERENMVGSEKGQISATAGCASRVGSGRFIFNSKFLTIPLKAQWALETNV